MKVELIDNIGINRQSVCVDKIYNQRTDPHAQKRNPRLS